MNCPFCHTILTNWAKQSKPHVLLSCENETCMVREMTRYKITYYDYPNHIAARTLMIDDLYIQIYYEENLTVISKLDGCILSDCINISRALDVDLENPTSILTKIRTLMVFS